MVERPNLARLRLYPVDYRYRPRHQQFRKYQWIEVVLEEAGHGQDKRPESRRPNLDSIQIIGEPLDTKNNWATRRQIIDAMPHNTVNELKAKFDIDRTSLGIVRRAKTID
ncbi:MAG: hypothetical protein WD468_06475 [Pirellulales bacterium]